GMFDEKVRIEIFHAGGAEEVTPKVVEGFFDVTRSRRLGKPKADVASIAPAPLATAPASPSSRTTAEEIAPPSAARPPQAAKPDPEWRDLIDDPLYRKVFELLAEHQIVNEAELEEMLGSVRKMRAFGRAFDELLPRVPFA